MENPESCRQFETCSAPLCPLDPDLNLRNWFPEEPICRSHKFVNRWVRKQRKLQRRTPAKWLGVLMTADDLIQLSRPRPMTDDQRNAARDRLRNARSAKKEAFL